MTIQEYIKILFEVEINAHVAHWQTKSYAEHKALNELYEGIVEYRDRLVESSQTDNIITGYKSPILNENMDIISYLEGVIEDSYLFREDKQPYIQQITDEVIEFISKIKYKLTFLK